VVKGGRTVTRFALLPAFILAASATACSSDEDPASTPNSGGTNTASGGSAGSARGGTSGASGTSGTSGTSGSSSATGGTGNGGSGGSSGRAGRAGRSNSGGSSNAGNGGGSGNAGNNSSGTGNGGNGGSNTGGTGNGGSGGDSGNAGNAGDMGSAGAAPSDGCSSGSKPTDGHYTITVGSTERGYELVASSTNDPVPLVFEFHGAGGDGSGIIGAFGLEASLGGKVVLIAPDGVDQGGNGIGWGSGNNNPDIDLVKALIERAKQDHCIDSSRIYAIGFSWGGWMASQTACALGGAIAGFASVEGGGPMGNSCAGPVAGMVVHGTADTAEPISSGIATRDKYKTIDGCGDTLGASTIAGCQQYSGCTKPLLWCQHDGEHYIPDFVNEGLPGFFALSP